MRELQLPAREVKKSAHLLEDLDAD